MSETRPAKTNAQTVLVVSADRPWLQGMARALSAVPDMDCVTVDMAAFREGKFDRRAADAMVIDIDDGAALRDERLFARRQETGAIPLVVLSGDLAHDLARLVVRLGSADWLRKPADPRQIVDALTPLMRVKVSGGNRVYAVLSCVGGAGGTTLAISAAHAASREGKGSGNRCALVDLDFTKASCGFYLDVQNDVDLAGVVDAPQRVDAEFMDLVRHDYRDRFSVFSFARPEVAYAPTCEEFVLRMMDVVSFQYRTTVIDVPYHYTPWRDRILEAADGVMLVTELTIPAIRQAQVTFDMLVARRRSAAGIVVVVNHHRSRLFSRSIGKKDLEKSFGDAAIHMVPDDWDTLQDAVNRGVAPADAAPRSKFVRAAGTAIGRLLKKEAA